LIDAPRLGLAIRLRRLAAAALLLALTPTLGLADGSLHTLWQIQGKHNTVYLMGSIHTLRPGDYPLPKPLLDAYADAPSLVMEIDLADENMEALQQEMLMAAGLPEDKTLRSILGPARFDRAQSLVTDSGVDLSMFDQFAPWFVAEAVSQLQLMKLGFQPSSGVEMYFLDKAKADGKHIDGLETAQDQIALFQAMSDEAQADYLISSLEEAKDLPREVDSMVSAWKHGDTGWFQNEIGREFGRDPKLFSSLLASRNRKWVPKIEALLGENRNYLVIVGAGHLVGRDSVISLLKSDGWAATQH
jgi:uncharacterized protein YbaP (TraB family)